MRVEKKIDAPTSATDSSLPMTVELITLIDLVTYDISIYETVSPTCADSVDPPSAWTAAAARSREARGVARRDQRN